METKTKIVVVKALRLGLAYAGIVDANNNGEDKQVKKDMDTIRRTIDRVKSKTQSTLKMIVFFGSLLLLSSVSQAQAFVPEIDSQKAIMAIIGEAEGEGFSGMLAVADAIRNRGSLKGVYGLNSPRVKQELFSRQTLELAKHAWEMSKDQDITNGSIGWGNDDDIATFAGEGWWKNCEMTIHIGHHWFYKIKDQFNHIY